VETHAIRILAIAAAVALSGCVERDTYACKAEAMKAYPDPYCQPLTNCSVNWDWLYGTRKGYVSECMAGKGWLQKKGCTFVSDDPDCFEPDWWHKVQTWFRSP
jgi:hypothetical protein